MPSQLIIGNRGQDGQLLSTRLQKKNLEFFSLNRSGLYDNNNLIYDYNSLSVSAIMNFFQKAQIEKIFFFASHSLPSAARSHEKIGLRDPHFEIEVLLVKVLDAISRISQSIKLVFASSSLRYGELHGVITEDTTSMPSTIYGLHKIKCENIIIDFANNYNHFSFLNAILFNHTSVFQDPEFLFPKIISAIKRNNLNWIIDQIENEEKTSNFIDLGYAPHFVQYLEKLSKTNYSGNCIISTGFSYPIVLFFQMAKDLLEKKSFEDDSIVFHPKFQAKNDLLMKLIGKNIDLVSGKELFDRICYDYRLQGFYGKA